MRDFKFTEQERPTMANFNARFDAIAALANGLGNEYVWEKSRTVTDCGYTSTTTYTKVSADCAITKDDVLTKIRYGTTFEEVAFGGGEVGMFGNSSSQFEVLRGKYFVTSGGHKNGNVSTTDVYYADENATISQYQSYSYTIYPITQYVGTWATSETTTYGYVNSPDPNAYPPAESDGYTYTALGQLGAKTQIATGSYVGTGTYGSSNPNSLTFGFVPKFVVIKKKNAKFGYYGQLGVYLDGGTTLLDISGNSESGCNASVSGNTLSWYSTKYNSQQFNDSTHDGGYYSYIAIG